jgi:hypothetical protein
VRILLDECVDRRLARELAGHEVSTVPEQGWAGAQNGELLALAEKQFDVFLIACGTCCLLSRASSAPYLM